MICYPKMYLLNLEKYRCERCELYLKLAYLTVDNNVYITIK